MARHPCRRSQGNARPPSPSAAEPPPHADASAPGCRHVRLIVTFIVDGKNRMRPFKSQSPITDCPRRSDAVVVVAAPLPVRTGARHRRRFFLVWWCRDRGFGVENQET
ncbi:hypothetical protein PHJA_002703000 [Phtheirospermum japonicum]|uniref:Uncharacterized protein n=1 Tax=Phtheirospermum japonicum TaxID=374723 RepID=A0A830D6W8_9LAMI|nr:hypothetical protein PHJA_002703000 [Phtheirospermum japonicum]